MKAVRQGMRQREVARQFGVSLSTVQEWLARAGDQRLDRVDFSDRKPGPTEPVNKTAKEQEDVMLTIRKELKETSALGEYGAPAIRREMERRRLKGIPSERTIGRILQRRGAVDGRQQFPACWGNFRRTERRGSLGKPRKNTGQVPFEPWRTELPGVRMCYESPFGVTPYSPGI